MTTRWKPNVTVAAVIEQQGRFLLVEEDTRDGLRLNTPAGHLDPGEGLLDACRREVREETAYDFAPMELVGIYLNRFCPSGAGEDLTYLRFTFCGQLGRHFPEQALDTGIVRTLWLSLEQLQASRERHRSPVVLRCVQDYLAGRRYPAAAVTVDPSIYLPGPDAQGGGLLIA
ncbi:MAG: NUDIX hydrolase [Comamonadaceae bacterium]|nr:NUDIX hydrolase [Comamonadaceae bacterium]